MNSVKVIDGKLCSNLRGVGNKYDEIKIDDIEGMIRMLTDNLHKINSKMNHVDWLACELEKISPTHSGLQEMKKYISDSKDIIGKLENCAACINNEGDIAKKLLEDAKKNHLS